MTPRICVSILPKSQPEAMVLINTAEAAKADFIEVRLDLLDAETNLKELFESTKVPLIATHKMASESGFSSHTEAERLQSLLKAAECGFEYVDIDLSHPNLTEMVDNIKRLGAKPIVSYHKTDGSLSRSAMDRVLEQEIAAGASVCKIITSAKKTEDNLAALNFVAANSGKAKLVCFCMGEAGKSSRLLSPLFGAFFTFASLEKGDETASGQMTIREMQAAYELLGAK